MAEPIDYAALAKQAGAISSSTGTVDYAALAKQSGAISSTPPVQQAPQGSPVGRFLQGAWDNSVGGLWNTGKQVASALARAATGDNREAEQLIGGLIQSHIDQGTKAAEAFKRGRYTEAAGHLGAAALPLVGPAAAAIGEKIGGTEAQVDKYGNVITPGQAPDIAGGVGGAVGLIGSAAAPAAVKAVKPYLPESIRITPSLKNPNPVKAAAVDWGLARNPEMVDPATATGNPVVRGVQWAVDRSPAGTFIAEQAKQNQASALAQTGAELAEEAAPGGGSITPHQAGSAVVSKFRNEIQASARQAQQEYSQAWEAERDPMNQRTVPVLDREGNAVIDAETKKPKTQDMPLPVDMGNVQDALRPVLQQYEYTLPETDIRASVGLKALKNIVNGPRWKPASQAEMDLGMLKEAARAEMPELRDTSQGLAAMGVKQLDRAIHETMATASVPGWDPASGGANPALSALERGRQLTAQKWDLADTLKSFGRKIEDLEPVQVFQQLTWGRDAGIQRLNEIAKRAPDAMPQVGRAYIEGLLDTATREGGFDKARTVFNEWQRLGPETKKVLFKSPGLISDLDNFFQLAKQAAENPNPSGTAHQLAVMGQTGLIFTHPITGIPYVIGTGVLAKLLHSPKAAAILTEGLRVPIGGTKAVATANALAKLADENGGGPAPGGPNAPGTPPPGGPGGAPPPPAPPRRPAPTPDEIAATWQPKPGMLAGPVGLKPARAIAPDQAQPRPVASIEPIPPNPKGQLSKPTLGGISGVADEALDDASSQRAGTSGPQSGRAADSGPDSASGGARPGTVGDETAVKVPGSPTVYRARYAVRELEDVQASHSGHSFEPNPKYRLKNDRDYTSQENQGKVVNWSTPAEFDPSFHLTDNPDAQNGPILIDSQGNALGGNGRAMILERVYDLNPAGAEAYRKLLTKKAAVFGIDPEAIAGMKRPVLVREISDADLASHAKKQQAITDFNVKGTAALKPAEQAIADSRRVSQQTLDHIASELDNEGEGATLAQILEGGRGVEVVNRLIQDGVIAPQERAAYMTGDALTPAGKDRVSKLMLGRFFSDPAQLDNLGAALRNKIERVAAPLSQLEREPYWSLTRDFQQAMQLLEEKRAYGAATVQDVLNQHGLYANEEFAPEAVQLAEHLQKAKPTDLQYAIEQYLAKAEYAQQYQGPGMFGEFPEPETPAQAFKSLFGAKELQARPKPQKQPTPAGPLMFGQPIK